MVRDRLESAASTLDAAAEDATDGDVEAALAEHAETLHDLARREQPPDHGRMDRHIHTLSELAEDANALVADHIEDAIDDLREHRKTLDGV